MRRRWGWSVVPIVLTGVLALMVWDNWYVNFDAGFYLPLAHNLANGEGYRFPDGSFASVRGPGFASLIALAWSVTGESVHWAMRVSRAVLVANGALLAILAWRLTRRRAVALVAGLLVVVQPMMLISGGLWLVPDGLAAGVTLLGLVVVFWTGSTGRSAGRLVVAGSVLGLAFLTKESYAVALLVPAAVAAMEYGWRFAARAAAILLGGWWLPVGAWLVYALVADGRLPDLWFSLHGIAAWILVLGFSVLVTAGAVAAGRGEADGGRMSAGLVAGTVFGVALLALVVAAGPPLLGLAEFWPALRSDLAGQMYRSSPWALLLPGLALSVVVATKLRASIPIVVATALSMVGLAGLGYAVLSGLGLRNGVLLAYGVAFLIAAGGVWMWDSRPHWPARVGAAIVVALFAAGSVWASYATDRRTDRLGLTSENAAVAAAGEWLHREAQSDAVGGTPLHFGFMWFAGGGTLEASLVPIRTTGRRDFDVRSDGLRKRVWWAGTIDAGPRRAGPPLVASVTRSTVNAVYGEDLVEYLSSGVRYVVVTGDLEQLQAPLDGGVVLPILEASPAARQVFSTSTDHLPDWVVIYEIDPGFRPPDLPTQVRLAVGNTAPEFDPNQFVYDIWWYRSMVLDVLNRRFDPSRIAS